ncbi:MAG: DUF1330 domain-containing protein [bacterium]
MPAYVIVDISVTDPKIYAEYMKVAPATIANFGGKYVVRGGKAEKLEGEWAPRRVVVLEFPSYDRAKAWWASPEYRTASELRERSATANMIVVEGL